MKVLLSALLVAVALSGALARPKECDGVNPCTEWKHNPKDPASSKSSMCLECTDTGVRVKVTYPVEVYSIRLAIGPVTKECPEGIVWATVPPTEATTTGTAGNGDVEDPFAFGRAARAGERYCELTFEHGASSGNSAVENVTVYEPADGGYAERTTRLLVTEWLHTSNPMIKKVIDSSILLTCEMDVVQPEPVEVTPTLGTGQVATCKTCNFDLVATALPTSGNGPKESIEVVVSRGSCPVDPVFKRWNIATMHYDQDLIVSNNVAVVAMAAAINTQGPIGDHLSKTVTTDFVVVDQAEGTPLPLPVKATILYDGSELAASNLVLVCPAATA